MGMIISYLQKVKKPHNDAEAQTKADQIEEHLNYEGDSYDSVEVRTVTSENWEEINNEVENKFKPEFAEKYAKEGLLYVVEIDY